MVLPEPKPQVDFGVGSNVHITRSSGGKTITGNQDTDFLLVCGWVVAVQVVNPLYVEPGLTSILIEIGAQDSEIAAVGV